MEAIGSALNNLDLVVDAFDFAGMNRVVAVVFDTVPIAFQRVSEFGDCGML